MNTDRLNYINIGLMVLSATVAVYVPFELFLFSYVILGPLHYLTELSWLRKRQFFSPGRHDHVILAVLSALVLLPALLHFIPMSPTVHLHLKSEGRVMLFVAFATAGILILVHSTWMRIVAVALTTVIGFIFRSQAFITVLFALFIPTIIHVFVFTGAFLLLGAMRTKSLSGTLSLIVFAGCAVGLFFIFPKTENHALPAITSAYNQGFFTLNRQIFAIFLHQKISADAANHSATGMLLMRFIAFAYTYHYLNWFSKTSVIRWHDIPGRALAVIITIWVIAVTLYFINYLTGLAVLYYLSMLHVIFEFPLNFQTFKAIAERLRRPGINSLK